MWDAQKLGEIEHIWIQNPKRAGFNPKGVK
jgi:hypothetical protein